MIDSLMEPYYALMAWYGGLTRVETFTFVLASAVVGFLTMNVLHRIWRNIYRSLFVKRPHAVLLDIRHLFRVASDKKELQFALTTFSRFLDKNGQVLRMQITEDEFETMQFTTVKGMCLDAFEYYLEDFERRYSLPVTRRIETMERVA